MPLFKKKVLNVYITNIHLHLQQTSKINEQMCLSIHKGTVHTWAYDSCFKPNIYQVWTFYEIILAMQTGGQKKHREMPDPMFGYGASGG